MEEAAQIRAETERLRQVFRGAGAAPVDADILQPSEVLLDLYGEDIRGRAYVTSDPVLGEVMLRPDFTVPIAQLHMASGAAEGCYSYSGPVFRKQDSGFNRASEYVQAGYELFGQSDEPAADARVFSVFHQALEGRGLSVATGDISLLRAGVAGLRTSPRRKAALMRHLWRPQRFLSLLNRFGGRSSQPQSRLELVAAADPMTEAGPEIGLRGRGEIEARIAALKADAAEPAISGTEISILEDILGLKDTMPNVLSRLMDLNVDLPSLGTALDQFSARLDALDKRGIDVSSLAFEGSYGRSTMEYYDGFVFGFSLLANPHMPPVSTGGRYNALTRALGQGRGIPAVGGMIRPALLLDQEG
jgi:ATP phosphoribosyltransferase regulatory subunit